ncbi:hypothetical protein [Methylomonas sp. AM2-LC]|uniref:hypothetical protein n=1 Tax=Methylomonas sp. AM2-LC TaxID=3153301 RepID=UPI003266CC6E
MEINSLSATGLGIITSAQQKATTASQTIANLSTQNGEVGGTQITSPNDMFKPILSLKEAEQETYAGIKLLRTQKNEVGSLLNIKA